MATQTIVVIGGAQGGPVAAARAREFAEDARIILVEKQPHVSWVQAGLKHHLRGEVGRLEDLDADRAAFFQARYRIDVRTNTEAIGLDNDARRVVVKTPNGTERIAYDAVIFAGGAGPVRPKVPGLDGPGLVSFRNYDDLNAIRELIAAGAKRAVVLGAGGYGVEAAEGLRAAGLEVTMVERDKRILPGLSLQAAQAAAAMLRKSGIVVRTGCEILSAEPFGTNGRRLHMKAGDTLETDMVVLAAGMRPRSKLLKEAGASLHADGTIRVDRYMQTTLPRVFACGTAVSVPHAITGRPTWLVQDAIIDRTAQIAGRNAAVGQGGVRETQLPVAGTRMHQIGDIWFASTGLSDAEARSALGDERVAVVTVHSWSSEVWLGGDVISVRMVVDKELDAVVGGEVWGRNGVPRRIDILAAAVLDRWSPSRVADLDVAYAPGLGPAYDPVNAAGTLAAMTSSGEARAMAPEVLGLRLAKGDGVQLVNVGKPDGKDTVWPPSTISMPLEELRERLTELDRDRPVVLVSHTGRRAHIATRILQQRGFNDVYFLDGGGISWSLLHSS